MIPENIIQIIITSIIQGITEFLPISSSGHIALINEIFNWQDINLTFMITAHLGTLMAVIIYFWDDVKKFFLSGLVEVFKKEKTINSQLFLNIFLSTLPIIFVGLLLRFNKITFIYDKWIIIAATIFFSLILYISDKYNTKKELHEISVNDALTIGIFQIFALIPGSSRAGLCISAARFLGFNRICSAKYSMYLSIPVIIGATSLMFLEIIKQEYFFSLTEFVYTFFLSFTLAYFSISFFIKLLKKINLTVFVVYRIIFSLFFLFLFF